MSSADRLGWAALVMTALGVAIAILWASERWIGWAFVGVAALLGTVWTYKEVIQKFGKDAVFPTLEWIVCFCAVCLVVGICLTKPKNSKALNGLPIPKEVIIAPSEQHETTDKPVVKIERNRPVKSGKIMIPKEILDQWKKDAPRQWRKNPLGQSIIGLQQTFEAGICDQGIPDLTREIPGPWQNWGLQGARFGCPSNQFATQGTIDFDPKGFSYASSRTIIPSNFLSQ